MNYDYDWGCIPPKELVERVRDEYPEGQRLRAVSFAYTPGRDSVDDNKTVPPGTEGTVDWVDDAGQVHTKWDNGHTIAALVLHNDVVERI